MAFPKSLIFTEKYLATLQSPRRSPKQVSQLLRSFVNRCIAPQHFAMLILQSVEQVHTHALAQPEVGPSLLTLKGKEEFSGAETMYIRVGSEWMGRRPTSPF